MEVLNNDQSMDNKITSRYSIVIAAAKRARQIIDGAEPLIYTRSDKAVSIAVNEIYKRKIKINAGTTSNTMVIDNESLSER
jgi:DNA-directed RNA polymerase subunit omega